MLININQVLLWEKDFDRNNLTRWCHRGLLVKLRNQYYAFPEYRQVPDFSRYVANRTREQVDASPKSRGCSLKDKWQSFLLLRDLTSIFLNRHNKKLVTQKRGQYRTDNNKETTIESRQDIYADKNGMNEI